MRLGFYTTMAGSPWGGSEELWAAAATAAADRGDDVHLFLLRWETVPERVAALVTRKNVTVHYRPRHQSFLRRAISRLLTSDSLLTAQLRDANCDFVFVSQGSAFDLAYDGRLASYLIASATPFALICQHNEEGTIGRSVADRFLPVARAARAVLFVAERNRLVAERQLAARIPNTALVRNPFNVGQERALPWPTEAGVVELGCVARLEVHYKGQDVLFEALAAPEFAGLSWRLTLYGQGPDRGYLEALAKMYGIGDRVRFAGQVSDVTAIWRASHILALSSRSEGTPLSLVEAMVCGRPALVTAVGDSALWVEDGVTGFVADAPSKESVVKALRRAWDKRSDWEDMGRAARTSALSRIDPDPGESLLRYATRGRR